MSKERVIRVSSGWPLLALDIALIAGAITQIARGAARDDDWMAIGGVVLAFFAALISKGFFIVNPNHAALLLLFGAYQGSVKSNGFFWANPFLKRIRVSLRVRNHESAKLKVNDKTGNPIEIAAVVVWKVVDTFQAEFEVDDYEQYVKVQSESAIRHMAGAYAYDDEEGETTLRGTTDEVSEHLQSELQNRLVRAGVQVMEARLTHLAYAPEIAGAMLRRQQASAVIAARTKIVEGAVGMVELALEGLTRTGIVQLDEDRKAAMVSNLLVVLCGEQAAEPVINTGTLYS
jgi:hypothetical protein